MNKPSSRPYGKWLIGLALCGALFDASAKEVVQVFRGSESRHTAEFEVQAPWIVDWYVTSDGAGMLGVDVSLEEAGTGIHKGSVLVTKWPGNGVRLFDQGGKFYFRVNSTTANWILKVEQLTRAEAEAYTPKER